MDLKWLLGVKTEVNVRQTPPHEGANQKERGPSVRRRKEDLKRVRIRFL